VTNRRRFGRFVSEVLVSMRLGADRNIAARFATFDR
jgi:hypothetical protein